MLQKQLKLESSKQQGTLFLLTKGCVLPHEVLKKADALESTHQYMGYKEVHYPVHSRKSGMPKLKTAQQ